MSYIDVVRPEDADGKLEKLYQKVRGPEGQVDHVLQVHSLRPHTLEGHMALYKSVLHHSANQLPQWFLETLGVYVSLLNGCEYCVEHHYRGLWRLLQDEQRAEGIRDALMNESFDEVFDAREQLALRYSAALTKTPAESTQSSVEMMREAGYDDGEILEINQVVSYFAYANRMVLGLGVSLDGDVLGLAPSDTDRPDDWSHR